MFKANVKLIVLLVLMVLILGVFILKTAEDKARK